MNNQKKNLIIAPPWIGDMVMTHALVRLLKKRDPDCIIDVFAMPLLHPLISRMPEVNNWINSPLKHRDIKLYERFKIGKSLRKNGYTHAYLVPNSFKSALIPFFAKIPVRVGWRGEQRYFLINDMRILDEKRYPRVVERFVALGCKKGEPLPDPLFLPQLQVSQKKLKSILTRFNIATFLKKPILAICPGPKHIMVKRWPPEYFAEVALAKRKEGWEVWILGGSEEQELAKIIQEKTNNICLDFTGKTDLGEVVDLLSLASLVIVNDSGLMHVAASLSKPLIAIYGPTVSELTPPLSLGKFKILSLHLSCSPCDKGLGTKCVLGHNKCMYDLKPELVLKAIGNLT